MRSLAIKAREGTEHRGGGFEKDDGRKEGRGEKKRKREQGRS
jgi:hypothetical protein